MNDRLKTVHQHGLCRLCLDERHTAKQCDRGFTCRISGCGKDHHYLLHSPSESVDERNPRNPSRNAGEGSADSSNVQVPNTKDSSPLMASARELDLVTVAALEAGRPRVCFKVVSVKIRCPGGTREIITHAFLDSGSDASLCLDSLAREIGVTDMKPISYTMTTANCTEGELRHGHEVQLEIESLEGDAKFRLENVLTTSNLPFSARLMATNEDIKRWPHLCDVNLPETGDKKVTILIGNDRPDLIDKQLDRKGDQGEPVAVRTPLGWTVHGLIGETVKDRVHINFAHTGQDSLSIQLERMHDEEFVEADANAEEGMSVEDRKAQELMDQSATLVNRQYQLKLPFRQEKPDLPESLSTATSRLSWLERKMWKDQVFHRKYSGVMDKYLTEGASRRVPDDKVSMLKPLWYLPHHAVWHPRKPEETAGSV